MIVAERGSFLTLMYWQWRTVLVSLFSAGVVLYLHEGLGWTKVVLPNLPLAVVGAALGIFVSFRTNSGYDRWWEGRKLWGRMINSSRHFATQVLSYFPHNKDGSPSPLQKELVHRHIAYVHTLRCLLRLQDPLKDKEVTQYLTEDEQKALQGQTNMTHALLQSQSNALVGAANQGDLNEFRLQSMDRTIAALLDIQGGCERIKKTPVPRGYGFIAKRLIWFYAMLFPLGVISYLGYWTLPINVLVCLSFMLISEVGRVLEDPFNMYYNALPLHALSNTIERNLCQRLGETELAPATQPSDKGILM
ncbi:MAG: hypothetical protein EP343_28820 [Deltaproteobacteria bacterium]|nr:MAG: hypothetical protein EP343_28820 [Deltaproteobacteria bacterium]